MGRLDLPAFRLETVNMKFLLSLLAVALGLGKLNAGTLALDGTLSQNVTEPECAIRLKGTIQNVTSAETGTIKLVSWATRTSLPAGTTIVGEFTLGQLSAGYQFTDFTVKSPSLLPTLDGTYNFTIAVLEYTTAGWRNQLLIQSGSMTITGGKLVGQTKWKIPSKTVIAPPSAWTLSKTLTLTSKATGELYAFPTAWRENSKLTFNTTTKLLISNRGRTANLSYTYLAGRAKLKGHSVKTGKLTLSDGPGFETKILLYFDSDTSGIYKSIANGALWKGDLNTSTAWGTFTLK